MDRVIRGYLDRFVSEFDLDCVDDPLNFEKFCIYSVLRNELSYLGDEDIEDISVGNNKGIDAICLAINGNPIINIQEIEDVKSSKNSFDVSLYFLQAKTSPKFDDSEIGNFCDTVFDFLLEIPQYELTPKAKEYHEIYLEILKLLSYIKNFNCKLFYCSTGAWNEGTSCAKTIKKKKENLIKSGIFKSKKGDTVEIIPIDNAKLRKLFDKANQPLNAEFTFSQKINLNDIDNVSESYLGVLPFRELKNIIVDSETGKLKPLFYDNVRDFLGLDEEVNKKINQTIVDKQFSMFQLLNNGITIIAEDNKGRGDKFSLVNSQVVNGCQTSNILFLNRDVNGIDDLFVPVKLIITDDSDIRDKIIVSSNNQAEIREEQLLALTSFQKNLEEFYKCMGDGLRYERRKSQYSSESNIKKNAIVDIREQIKSYVAMFLEEPHVVSGYFSKVYIDRKDNIFCKDHYCEPYYISALTQYLFKKLLLAGKIERKYNKARYHIFMLFRRIAGQPGKVGSNNKKIMSYCNDILKIIRDDNKCLENFKFATNIIDNSQIDIDDNKEMYKKSTTKRLIEEWENSNKVDKP